MRAGIGYDSHIFEKGKPLFLGGVEFPGADGMKAHSDGDVLIHAIIDALLGAAALGDIGAMFPDRDARWKNARSPDLLARTVRTLAAAGWRPANVDATIVCETVRIRPRADAMRAGLAAILGLPVSAVSVKGKTNEGMDDTGRGRGIAVWAVATVSRIRRPRTDAAKRR